MRRFFSSPLTSPWKNVPRTKYVLEWPPGARVVQAWLDVEAMKRSGTFDLLGSGIVIAMCGSAMAEVGGNGRARKSGNMPDIKSVTTFLYGRRVFNLDPVWGGCSGGRDHARPWRVSMA